MIKSATYLVDDSDVSALRNLVSSIAGIGYCEREVRDRLGLSDLIELRWRALPIYRDEQLADRDKLDLVIDLFLLQGTISANELNQLFNTVDQDLLVRTGLLSIDTKGFASARASLYPVGDRLVFSDHAWPLLPHPGVVSVPSFQVMYVGGDSRWLARVTSRRPVGSALDLCTGSGVHALLAASHSQRVVAVDISPRAVRCTRFNAQILGAKNVKAVIGNLFDPVQGELFDLITANPPFVPSPVDSVKFRDGGHSGEYVQRHIIAGLPHHLAPGGLAQIVTELGERDDLPISGRLREWLGGVPMDIHILRLRTHSTANYAIGHAEGNHFDDFLASVRDWAGNLRTQGYSRVVSVLLAFQWSDSASGSPWTRSDDALPPTRDANAEIEAMFSAERMSRRLDLRDMLERSRVCRTGPVGLMETRVLGGDVRTKAQAHLLGKALPIFHWLDPVEREVLVLMEEPLEFPDLLALTRGHSLEDATVFAAVGSLIQRGIVSVIDGGG